MVFLGLIMTPNLWRTQIITKGNLWCCLCYFEVVSEDENIQQLEEENEKNSEVVEGFQEVFEESQGLQPQRESDHYIHLQPNSFPINVRPYRYPQFQKEED